MTDYKEKLQPGITADKSINDLYQVWTPTTNPVDSAIVIPNIENDQPPSDVPPDHSPTGGLKAETVVESTPAQPNQRKG